MKRPPPITEAEEARYVELQRMALDFARAGDAESLAPMLEAGLPVNLADAKGQTLLMLASYHGHLETVRLLLDREAEVDRRNDRGQTPLGGVAFKGYEDVADLLVAAGADVDADQGGGMTPILFAALFGRFGMVERLRSHGATFERAGALGRVAGFVDRIVHRRRD